MRWQGRRQSDNVDDRRGMSGPAMAGRGGLITIVLLFGLVFMGVDPRIAQIVAQFGGAAIEQQLPQQRVDAERAPLDPAEEELAAFTRVVLADTEDVWGRLFPEYFGGRYREPTLVMFTGRVQSACGLASAAVGPFYCPADAKVYVDLSFYDELQQRFGAPGDFAQAYVIAHEVGHHVQNLLGISDQVQAAQARATKVESNRLSVRLELQADFLAGVFAHHLAKYAGVLEEGDIREAIEAAAAIGDDRLQKQAQGYVVPDAFTHGSSEQRVRWFSLGYREGDPRLMDRAFEVDEL
jgi:predicted metalloprotease